MYFTEAQKTMKLSLILRKISVALIAIISIFVVASGSALAQDIPLENSGFFEVYADNKDGITVFDPNANSPAYIGEYEFTPTGIWKGGTSIAECDSCGDPDYPTDQMLDPEFDAFSLVINCSNGIKYEDCRTPRIPFLKMNLVLF